MHYLDVRKKRSQNEFPRTAGIREIILRQSDIERTGRKKKGYRNKRQGIEVQRHKKKERDKELKDKGKDKGIGKGIRDKD